MKPIVHSSAIVHENPWYRIRKDELTWPNGKPGVYYVAEFPGAAAIICVQDGKLLTVTQERYPTGRVSIEIPMGGIKRGSDPLETAKQELREETGFVAERWEKFASFFTLNGVARMPMHVFVADRLTESKTEHEDAETGIRVRWILLEEWREMIRRGEVTDGETLAAWMLYVTKIQTSA